MKKILTILLAAGTFASCQTSDDTDSPNPAASRVTISPLITRATEVNFEPNDQIGLTILRGDEVYAQNALLTFADNVFSGSLTWYSVSAETSTLTAYYPYDQAGIPTAFTVQTNQSIEGNYTKSDLMAAGKSEVAPSAEAVSMTFRHQLIKILLNTVNTSGSAIEAVILRGSVPTATVDIAAQTVTVADAVPADITAQQVEADKTYRAIVVPQTVAFTLVVKTADGKEWRAPLASATLAKGGQYTVHANVNPEGVNVSLSGQIENWIDEGLIPPASDEEEVAFEEHLDQNYFLYDGERYATVTLSNGTTWMADNLRYVPAGLTPSSDPAVDSHIWYPYELNYAQAQADGKVATNLDAKYVIPLTDAASIAEYGYLYDLYAALNGTEVTADNYKTFENARGICPPGWHIPNRAEYYDLIGATNPNASIGETSGNKTDPEALFWDASKNYASIANSIAGFGYRFSGYRFASATATRYQSTVVWSGNCTDETYYGKPALSYLMTSTAYQPNPSGVPQFFGVMSTFTTSNYPEGRLSLSYISTLCGQALRCVKDHDIDFYDKYKDTPLIRPGA